MTSSTSTHTRSSLAGDSGRTQMQRIPSMATMSWTTGNSRSTAVTMAALEVDLSIWEHLPSLLLPCSLPSEEHLIALKYNQYQKLYNSWTWRINFVNRDKRATVPKLHSDDSKDAINKARWSKVTRWELVDTKNTGKLLFYQILFHR